MSREPAGGLEGRGRYLLAAVLPLLVAVPVGFVLSALLVHGALLARGLEPWAMSPERILEAFGPLELSLSGFGNQLVFLLFALPALRVRERRRALLGASRPGLGTHLLGAVAMYSLAVTLGLAVTRLGLEGEGTLGQFNDVVSRMGLGGRLRLLPVLALGAGVAEEVFFRGLLFRRLLGVASERATVLISALAFGLVHLDPVHSSAAFVMGLFLGWLRLRAGSVGPGVSAHVASNGVVVLSHGWLDDVKDVPSFALGAGLVVFGLSLWALARRLRAPLSEGYTPRAPSSVDRG